MQFVVLYNNLQIRVISNLRTIQMARKQNPVDDFLVEVGDNIRRIRTRQGFTLEELGRDIGLDKSNMYRIEQGRNITLLTLMKIASFLGVSPNTLLPSETMIASEDIVKYVKKQKSSD
jgi:DNA-binding Xre family transcriptional regulator